VFNVLSSINGTDNWREWSDVDKRFFTGAAEDRLRHLSRSQDLQEHAEQMVLYQFKQFIVHRQHEAFHRKLEALGLRLYGDLQIGFSACDMWNRNNLFLPGYAMGAPPSRTNPDGQPWGYPVLDPNQYYGKN